MDQNTFFTGKLYLYRAFGKIGDHACVMLDRHVFFSSESAAYQLIAHLYLFSRKSQKRHTFMLGIVHTLV